jgi:general secretion pathway protein E
LNQLIESAALLPEMASIDARQLFEARAEASSRGVPVVRFLEEVHGWAPDALAAELGRLLRMPVLTMENLRALAPAFEKLPFNEAVAQECALFRNGERYVLAVGNPFLPHLRAWVEARIDVPAAWHLVHPANLAAFFPSRNKQCARWTACCRQRIVIPSKRMRKTFPSRPSTKAPVLWYGWCIPRCTMPINRRQAIFILK